MKYFSMIMTFLLPFLGNTVFAQTGMMVFGNCSVSENSSIGFLDEVLTLEGSITGQGELVMAGRDTQTVISHNQAIDRLVVANRKAVKLKGKLTIRKSLAVEQGNLVVETQSQMLILPNALVTLAAGSQLIRPSAEIQAGPIEIASERQQVTTANALFESSVLFSKAVGLKIGSLPIGCSPNSYEGPDLRNQALPPWSGRDGWIL
jgi:hypothetical protein